MSNKSNAAITTYSEDSGSSNTRSFYSFGASAGAISDRTLGSTASGGAYSIHLHHAQLQVILLLHLPIAQTLHGL